MSDGTTSLRRKIASAGDLQSVVRSMKALAASSIGQYEKSVLASADYYRTVELGLGACLRARTSGDILAMKIGDARTESVSAIVLGSDQGLVGQFNQVVAEFAVATLAPLPGRRQVWSIGDRVRGCLTDAGLPLLGVLSMPNSVKAIASLVGQIQIDLEAHRALDVNACVYVIYNRPRAGASPEPVAKRLLPFDSKWEEELVKVAWPFRNLPQVWGGENATLRALIREYVFISLFRACAESLASENASRLAAMERADKNINGLLENLESSFHRIRQQSIDEELFDVVAGFEALSGAKQ